LFSCRRILATASLSCLPLRLPPPLRSGPLDFSPPVKKTLGSARPLLKSTPPLHDFPVVNAFSWAIFLISCYEPRDCLLLPSEELGFYEVSPRVSRFAFFLCSPLSIVSQNAVHWCFKGAGSPPSCKPVFGDRLTPPRTAPFFLVFPCWVPLFSI